VHIVPWKHPRIFHRHLDPFCAQKTVAFVCHVNFNEFMVKLAMGARRKKEKKGGLKECATTLSLSIKSNIFILLC
jgi:hypothetical protein